MGAADYLPPGETYTRLPSIPKKMSGQEYSFQGHPTLRESAVINAHSPFI